MLRVGVIVNNWSNPSNQQQNCCCIIIWRKSKCVALNFFDVKPLYRLAEAKLPFDLVCPSLSVGRSFNFTPIGELVFSMPVNCAFFYWFYAIFGDFTGFYICLKKSNIYIYKYLFFFYFLDKKLFLKMGNFIGRAMDENMAKQQQFMLEMNRLLQQFHAVAGWTTL